MEQPPGSTSEPTTKTFFTFIWTGQTADFGDRSKRVHINNLTHLKTKLHEQQLLQLLFSFINQICPHCPKKYLKELDFKWEACFTSPFSASSCFAVPVYHEKVMKWLPPKPQLGFDQISARSGFMQNGVDQGRHFALRMGNLPRISLCGIGFSLSLCVSAHGSLHAGNVLFCAAACGKHLVGGLPENISCKRSYGSAHCFAAAAPIVRTRSGIGLENCTSALHGNSDRPGPINLFT